MNDLKINSTKDLYKIYGEAYPYACDVIAYFIFGNSNNNNIITKAFKGFYGTHTEVCYYDVSNFMLQYEYTWQNDIEYINDCIKNMPTKDNCVLSYYY